MTEDYARRLAATRTSPLGEVRASSRRPRRAGDTPAPRHVPIWPAAATASVDSTVRGIAEGRTSADCQERGLIAVSCGVGVPLARPAGRHG